MINIADKSKCCGCSGCVEACPKQCISFEEDHEGFRYPKVNLNTCINCGLCEKVCSVVNGIQPQKIVNVYAASNKDADIRRSSSSGGVFTYLAEQIINDGGIVYGAAYNKVWEVEHIAVEQIDDLQKLRSSKYMQSRMGDTFKNVRSNLIKGRKVLFSGTPCQVSGLKKFLNKKYDNLYCIDIICHGVPSPKIWRKYLIQLINNGILETDMEHIKDVNFRAKDTGWLNSKIVIKYEDKEYCNSKDSDSYYRAFTQNVSLRPICYNCPFKAGGSGSDLTIADFWGIKEVDHSVFDDNGVSMIIDYGKNKFDISGLNLKQEPTDSIKHYNGSFYHSSQYNANRKVLFGKIDKTNNIISLMNRCTHPTKIQRIKNVLYRKLSK